MCIDASGSDDCAPAHVPGERCGQLEWLPETGVYTGDWFNRDSDFINVEALSSSILRPFTNLIGEWFFMIV